MSFLFPENIRKVGLFALSFGNQGQKYFDTALKRLEEMGVQYELSLPEGGEYRYLAGNDKARAASFNKLLADDSIDLLFAIRGGFGAVRALPYIDWKLLLKRNIPVAGYSDVGSFLIPAWKKGFKKGIMGKMAEATFGSVRLSQAEIDCGARALHECTAGKVICPTSDRSLCAVKAGSATAPVIPCCLPILTSLIGTPWMPDLTNTILVLESVNTNACTVERSLTQLEQCGILSRLAGVVFGSFTNCDQMEYLPELYRDYGAKVPGPVCSDFKFGHDEPGAVIRVGGVATLEVSQTGTVSFA